MTAKIVVTGFEPWAHGTENPTLAVLDQLEASNDLPGTLATVRVPVDSRRLAEIVEATPERLEALRNFKLDLEQLLTATA